MRQCLYAILTLALAGAFATQAAHAQPPYIPPGPYTPPAYSPYLNLLRGLGGARRGSPAMNYYGLVRPELDFRSNIQNLQQQVTTIGMQTTAEQAASGLPTTGHAVQFMNTARYFSGSVYRSPLTRTPGIPGAGAVPGGGTFPGAGTTPGGGAGRPGLGTGGIRR